MSRLPSTYFLTGCASGIGRHLTDRLIAKGASICAADIDTDALHDYAQKYAWPLDRVMLATLDVCDPEAWERVFSAAAERFGHIEVCMNIAGILKSAWMHETTLHDTNAQIDVNTKGVIFGTQVAARHMIERGGGHIVNISSMAGIAPIPGLAVYTASKFAVRGFSLAAAVELRRHHVAVTAVCPDSVNTPLLDLPADNEAAAIIFSGGRLLTVDEVGDAILNHVLIRRPVEVALPWNRTLLAKLGSLFPRMTIPIVPRLQRKGHRAHQLRTQPPH